MGQKPAKVFSVKVKKMPFLNGYGALTRYGVKWMIFYTDTVCGVCDKYQVCVVLHFFYCGTSLFLLWYFTFLLWYFTFYCGISLFTVVLHFFTVVLHFKKLKKTIVLHRRKCTKCQYTFGPTSAVGTLTSTTPSCKRSRVQ